MVISVENRKIFPPCAAPADGISLGIWYWRMQRTRMMGLPDGQKVSR